MSLLIPEIYGSNPKEDIYSLIYSLPEIPSSISWNGDLLAIGHTNGVLILTPIPNDSQFAKKFPTSFQSEWVFQVINIASIKSGVVDVIFNSKYLLTIHDDYSLTLINHLDEQQISKGGIVLTGHHDCINSADVAESGAVVSAGDDRTIRIWNDDDDDSKEKIFRTDGIPTFVKFWIDNESDKVIIVEDGNVIKVLDYKRNQWLFAIYPSIYSSNSNNDKINDVLIHHDNIVVIGDGWKKTYDPSNLKGGSGYTIPKEEAQLTSWIPDSNYIHSSKSLLIGGIGQSCSSFYDLTSNNNQTYQFKLTLPSSSTTQTGSINQNGIVAIGSGVKLLIIRPFDSYEALQYISQ